MASRPRKHHYLPKFYLAGFTHSGDVHGDLYVLDLSAIKEWKSSPEQTANQRDFYAVDLGPTEDPSMMEQILGRLEAKFSRVIRKIVENERLPSGIDFDWFLNFVALMAVRIPRTRKLFSHVTDRVMKDQLRRQLASVEGWKQFKQVVEIDGKKIRDDEYEAYRRFANSEEYNVDLDQTSHVQMMVDMVDPLLPALAARNWYLGIAADDAPDLICSDFLVSEWPTKSADLTKPLTLTSPGTFLTFPITRRLIALATFERKPPVVEVNQEGIALFNTITARQARQLFAPGPDFTYLAHDKSIKRKSDLLQFLCKRQGTQFALEKAVMAWFAARKQG